MKNSKTISLKRTITVLFCTVLSGTLFFYSCNKKETITPEDTGVKNAVNFTPAKTNNELELLRANRENNVIRTLADFDALVSSKQSPLSKLPSEVISDFRNNLVVREDVGIVGLKYATIHSLLSEDEFAGVMAWFGLDTKNGFWGFSKNKDVIRKMNPARTMQISKDGEGLERTDYKEYKCVSPHNCEINNRFICLSGC